MQKKEFCQNAEYYYCYYGAPIIELLQERKEENLQENLHRNNRMVAHR